MWIRPVGVEGVPKRSCAAEPQTLKQFRITRFNVVVVNGNLDEQSDEALHQCGGLGVG